MLTQTWGSWQPPDSAPGSGDTYTFREGRAAPSHQHPPILRIFLMTLSFQVRVSSAVWPHLSRGEGFTSADWRTCGSWWPTAAPSSTQSCRVTEPVVPLTREIFILFYFFWFYDSLYLILCKVCDIFWARSAPLTHSKTPLPSYDLFYFRQHILLKYGTWDVVYLIRWTFVLD